MLAEFPLSSAITVLTAMNDPALGNTYRRFIQVSPRQLHHDSRNREFCTLPTSACGSGPMDLL